MNFTITKEGNYCNFVKSRDLQKNGFSFHTSNGLRVEEYIIMFYGPSNIWSILTCQHVNKLDLSFPIHVVMMVCSRILINV